jgi:hypothetical protein
VIIQPSAELSVSIYRLIINEAIKLLRIWQVPDVYILSIVKERAIITNDECIAEVAKIDSGKCSTV